MEGYLPTILVAVVLFIFAVVMGFDVITKVPPILHTPLVVASHAMAAIMVVSALTVAGQPGQEALSKILAVIALLLGVINVVGGYFVADRMLSKFKGDKSKKKAKE
jgi:NAD(P) transhydrogenase subunit alpha